MSTSRKSHVPTVGLASGTVELREYTAEWKKLFQEMRRRLRRSLKNVMVAHVGSTSVPGLKAKPIVDIAVAFKDLDSMHAAVEKRAALGFKLVRRYSGRNSVLLRSGDPTEYYFHYCVIGGPTWTKLLTFRDALRASPQLAEDYASVKEKLAKAHATERGRYSDAKTWFTSGVVARVVGDRIRECHQRAIRLRHDAIFSELSAFGFADPGK